MKKVSILLLLSLVIGAPVFAAGTQEANGQIEPLIGVSKFLAHPALDAVERGMQDYLEAKGIQVRYDFQNANADVSASAQIAQKFKSDKVDIAVGIATPVAQALVNVFPDTPVVFSAITDPLGAGLVTTYDTPYAENVAGVSDMNPVEAQIELLIRITGAKAIGNVYASGEANGVTLMQQAKAACEKFGVAFVPAAVANTSEVMQATQSIIGRVDAIYIATDNTVISALPSVDDVCSKAGIPLMAADPSGIEGLDVLVAWGFDYYKIGQATGEIIADILGGKHPGEIGTVFLSDPADFELWFNLDVAKKLGITIPADLIESAAVVIENDQKIIQ